MKKIIVIFGPTGSGKTELAKKIYNFCPSRIISIDSAMVYKDMNIGTAKPTQDELLLYPHDLIDIISPLESYSIAQCKRQVLSLVEKACSENKMPILVGGSMMYHYILQTGMHNVPETDLKVRASVQQEFQEFGLAYQWGKLCAADKLYADSLNSGDKQRIHRGLEILMLGNLPSDIFLKPKEPGVLSTYDFKNICLDVGARANLYHNLDLRFDSMVGSGLIDEVELLMDNYPGVEHLASFRSIGYRQIAQYVLGNVSKTQAIENAKTATRRYAKRQLTWIRSWPNYYTKFDKNILNKENEIKNYLNSVWGSNII